MGAYIFTDLDRLCPSERELAAAIWRQLSRQKPGVRLLNDPARALGRYELMCELAGMGENQYRARRLTDSLEDLRYPVFIRCEREHSGSLTPLLHNATELRRERLWMRIRAYRVQDLLVVEFCDTSDADGFFRKYSAFVVGDEVLPRHLFISRNWHVKQPDRVDPETAREVEFYIQGNPHAGQIRRIFRRAGIDYGRIDYSMAGDKLQVWEINTNPTVRKLAEPLTAAFAQLDPGSSTDTRMVSIHVNSRLLAAAERERELEQHTRRRRDCAYKGRIARLAASLLRIPPSRYKAVFEKKRQAMSAKAGLSPEGNTRLDNNADTTHET